MDTEPVVDTHDRDALGTQSQHAKKRRMASLARSVADACRHRDDRSGGQPSYGAGQRRFHASDHNYHIGVLELVCDRKEAVEPCHADVGDDLWVVAIGTERRPALLSNRKITGPGTDDHGPFVVAALCMPDERRPDDIATTVALEHGLDLLLVGTRRSTRWASPGATSPAGTGSRSWRRLGHGSRLAPPTAVGSLSSSGC